MKTISNVDASRYSKIHRADLARGLIIARPGWRILGPLAIGYREDRFTLIGANRNDVINLLRRVEDVSMTIDEINYTITIWRVWKNEKED